MHECLQRLLGAEAERCLEEWKQLLRFPSVSADPARAADCRACAGWLAERLKAIGLPAELLETGGLPAVWAERPGQPGRPVVLFYGHYDVQPADPLAAWTTPPFEPALRGGRLYARGAQDNKGQLFYALKAFETSIREGRLACGLRVLIEGEEESGSRGLRAALPGWRSRLAADVVLVTDTGMPAADTPALIMGLRGIVHLAFALAGPRHDLHSGVHGGVAPNPALGLARVLASLHGPDGAIAVPGFLDGVLPPSARELALAAARPFDAAQYRAQTGVEPLGGESGLAPALRAGFRPSIDVNGLHSGAAGPGVKTIIPARAEARLSARLVPRQDPERCLAALVRHVRAQTPAGLRLELLEQGAHGPGFRLDPDSALVNKAKRVLDGLTGRPAVWLWEGASIPIVAQLAELSGGEPILAGFGLEEDRIHAPDESFSLEQFCLGYRFVTGLLAEL